METKHTPGPYFVEYNGLGDLSIWTKAILAKGSPFTQHIATLSNRPTIEETEANAAFIVHACNVHEELVEACKEWIAIWQYLRDNYPDIELPMTLYKGFDAAGRLRAALAKAEGKGVSHV